MGRITSPLPGEYPPYARPYVLATTGALDAQGSLHALLADQPSQLTALLVGHPPEIAKYAYAPGKWTLAESLVHVVDTERVFAYRLLRIARGDETPLPGFDQDAWVPESRATDRSLDAILAEFRAVRLATIALVGSLDEIALNRAGTASNHAVSARALVWMIAGHAAHHIGITAERYLAPASGH